MAQTQFDRLRELGAYYWKPALSTAAAIVAGLNSAKDLLQALGLSPDKLPFVASTTVARWAAVVVLIGLLVLLRFQRFGFAITRLLLGRPKTPAAAGRIFRGPRPYGRDDVLPGRQAEVDDCVSLAQDRPFLVLEGESGCGKTSFLNAGLLPRIRDRFRLVEARIAEDPFGKLRAALAGEPYGAAAPPTSAPQLASAIAAAARPAAAESLRPLLLCIDQLEELFVTCPDTVRVELLAVLRDAVGAGHLRLLMVIRSDFLDLLLKLCRLVDPAQKALNLGSYYTLGAFTRAQAATVLTQLLAPIPRDNPLVGQQLDDFTEELVGDLLRSPRDRRLCPSDEKTVLPVELQTVGIMLEAVGLEHFSVAGIRRLGGKLGLLQRYIDDAKTYVWRKTGVAPDRALLVLRELVSPAQTKWAQSSRAIAGKHSLPGPQVDAVLEAFADRYLVARLPVDAGPADGPDGPPSARYELMHEHLVHLLLDAPDPLLQRVRAAEERLAFWTTQAQSVFAAVAPAGAGWRARVAARLRQPIPLLETLRLWRYARGPESRRVLRRNLARFGARVAVVVLVVGLPYGLLTAAQHTLPLAHYPINDRLAAALPGDTGYRFESVAHADPAADEVMVLVSFSGAGMRAAALSYGVLRGLRRSEIVRNDQRRSLLDEVDVVYGSAGGSLTAAYYALFGDRAFEDFEPRVLARNFQTELVYRALNPLTLFRLNSPYFGRGDLLAEMYDDAVFQGRTFGNLRNRQRRPFLVIGATDSASGTRFEFTQDYFDLLCSDLSSMPVGRAVAASMTSDAWGGTPIVVRNHAPCPVTQAPMELRALRERGDASLRSREAAMLLNYLDHAAPHEVRLTDGGLADGSGMRGIATTYARVSSFIGSRVNRGLIKQLVFIVVNPGAVGSGGADAVAQRSLDFYRTEAVETVRARVTAEQQAYRAVLDCQRVLQRSCPAGALLPAVFRGPPTHIVEINFDHIGDEAVRRSFLDIPTTAGGLGAPDVKRLVTLGEQLLTESPEFRRMITAPRP